MTLFMYDPERSDSTTAAIRRLLTEQGKVGGIKAIIKHFEYPPGLSPNSQETFTSFGREFESGIGVFENDATELCRALDQTADRVRRADL